MDFGMSLSHVMIYLARYGEHRKKKKERERKRERERERDVSGFVSCFSLSLPLSFYRKRIHVKFHPRFRPAILVNDNDEGGEKRECEEKESR